MFGWNPGMMDPYAAPMGGMQPQLDPSFGVQMPQMPGYDQFQFDPRQNLSMPLIQAGAAMLASGDDFMGGLGRAGSAFGSVMQNQEDRARQIHDRDYQREMNRYRLDRGEARDEIGDKRWGYGEETRLSENDEKQLEARREKDRATMARREQNKALGGELQVIRDPLESEDAYEVRLRAAEQDRQRKRDLEDYKTKREYDAIGETGTGAALTGAIVNEMQEASFIPAEQMVLEDDDVQGEKAFNEKTRRTTQEQAARGFVPKMSGDNVVGYVMSPTEARKSDAILRKKQAGLPITESDLPMQVMYEIDRAVAGGAGLSAIQDLMAWGMSAEEAEKMILPRIQTFNQDLEGRAAKEKVESGDSGYQGREMPKINPLEERRERERRLGLGGVM